MNGATATSADCELLGRGPVQGPADSDSLAALVGHLLREQQRRDRLPLLGARRWCTVTCGRQIGLEIAPYQRAKRPDDEGFESDEDLASLGSYEDPGKRKTGTPAAAAGAVSDSANSSGASEDSADDADAASLLGEQTAGAIDAAGGRETYGLADVAFCHADADALPAGVAVWVIKTKRPAAAAGLEAIVVRSRDGRLQDVCRAYQELSRRLKLEPKPWTGGGASSSSVRGRTFVGVRNVTLTASPDINRRYNLVQRTDTDGVTHIEVTSGPVATAVSSSSSSAPRGDCSPSSIISISAPGPSASGDDDADGEQPGPPQRPERRKDKAKAGDSADDDGGGPRRQPRVVRGQFVRVNVVGHGAASPERRVSVVAARPPNKSGGSSSSSSSSSSSTASASSDNRLWSTADYDRPDHGRTPQHHSRSSSRSGGRNRSRSSGPGRRQPLQLAARSPAPSPQFSRYPNEQQQLSSSFGTRFMGKLREITTTGNAAAEQGDAPQPVVTFRRRNSVGESVAANFYPYYFNQIRDQQEQQLHHYYRRFEQQQQQQQQAVKNGGNLKSVIKKNKSSQPPYGQHAYDEPKKVTFSAYATVQVVD